MTLKELREKAVKALKDARSIIEKAETEKREVTADEDRQFTAYMEDHNKSVKEIQKRSDLEAAEKELAKNQEEARTKTNPEGEEKQEKREKITEETRANALKGWFSVPLAMRGDVEITDEMRDAAKQCGFSLNQREIAFDLRGNYRQIQREFRAAQTTATGSSGGFLIPEGFVSTLERALLEFGGARQVAEIMRTATGNDLPWPTSDDTSNKGEIIGDNATQNEQAIAFNQVIFKAYKYSSKMVKIPFELLQDSAIDLASLVGNIVGERVGRIQNDHFTTGTGAGQPKGIVTASTLGVTSASATAIKFDEVKDLFHSVDPAFRIGAGFMFHDGILQHLAKLKDGQGQYLLGGVITGNPVTLYGLPYTINQSMQATVATATKTMLFGQFNKYKIRDAGEVRLIRLDERYAELDQVAFVSFMRSDGNLLDAGVAPVKHLLQA